MKSTSTPATAPAARPGKTPQFLEIVSALKAWRFPPDLDGVVAIASGGVVPGALVAQFLGLELKTIAVSYRNAINEPQFPQPRLISSVPGLAGWRRALLVDDFHLSGLSLDTARKHLPTNVDFQPFVLIGDVDFALFRRPPGALWWPWSVG